MALVAKALKSAVGAEAVIDEIYRTTANQPNLTPRPVAVLNEVANRGDLVILQIDGKLAGWGVRELLVPGVKEVGLMFVKPELRSPIAFAVLARELTSASEQLLFATYDAALIRFVTRELGFQPASLWQLIMRSRGRFIAKRLGREARGAVAQHTKNARPLFAVRESR